MAKGERSLAEGFHDINWVFKNKLNNWRQMVAAKYSKNQLYVTIKSSPCDSDLKF